MQKPLLALVLATLLTTACAETSPTPTAPGDRSPSAISLGPVRIAPVRSLAAPSLPGTQANPMIYHGGPILPKTRVVAMYWGARAIYLGGPTPGETGPGSADQSLVGYFLNHLGGSPYFNINTTYYDTVERGHTVQNVVTYTSWWANNQNVPPTDGTPVSNQAIAAELSRGFATGAIRYDPSTVYLVFTAGNTNLGGFFGTQSCGYHGTFLYQGRAVIYAALPYTNQYPAACSANLPTPNGDDAADRVVSIVAHEIEEATTDYPLNVWLTASGLENADLCAFNYGPTYVAPNGGVANMTIGDKHFLVQQNWLNVGNGGCAQSYGPAATFVVSCQGGHRCSATSTSTAPGGTITSYRWTIDRGTLISTAPSFSRSFGAAPQVDLTLTVTDDAGLSNTTTRTIVFP